MSSGSEGSTLLALNRTLPVSVLGDSAYDTFQWASGRLVTKTQNLTGAGAQTDNLFQVTGSVLFYALFAEVTAVGDSTTLTGVKFETWDGTAALDLSDVIVGSGAVDGALFIREAVLGTALVFINPTAAKVTDPATTKIMFTPSIITQKTGGVATYIRIAYTGDVNTDVDILASIRYMPLTSDGAVVAV